MDAYALPLMAFTMVLLIGGGLWFDREPRRSRAKTEEKTPAPGPGPVRDDLPRRSSRGPFIERP